MGRFSRDLIRDFLLAGLLGLVICLPFFGEEVAFSFAAGCCWLGLNTALLSWLMAAIMRREGRDKLFIFILACAKIPAAYLILFWLFTRDFFAPAGLAAGLATLPVVILLQGLHSLYSAKAREGGGKTRPWGATDEEKA